MASYVVTGASQGLGFAFVEHLSKNPANVVIAIVRNKPSAEEKVKKAGFTNVSVVQGDVADVASIKAAAETVSEITGGKLDVLINNAALANSVAEFKTLSDFDTNFSDLTADFQSHFQVNVLGVVNVVHAFLPLIRKGAIKKVLNLGTGHADMDGTINRLELAGAGPYSVTKAAATIVIAKYNAAHKHEGILFITISPGFVSTERNIEVGSKPENMQAAQEMGAKFLQIMPHFTGPSTPAESVRDVLKVLDEASVEAGDGGTFVSHFGNKQWL